MALNPKMQITMTVEELEFIKETAMQRAEEMEWQLRVELAKLREVERNLARILGEPSAVPGVAVAPSPAVGRGTPSYGTPLPPEARAPIAAVKPAFTPPPPVATTTTTTTTTSTSVARKLPQPPPLPPNVRRLDSARKA